MTRPRRPLNTYRMTLSDYWVTPHLTRYLFRKRRSLDNNSKLLQTTKGPE